MDMTDKIEHIPPPKLVQIPREVKELKLHFKPMPILHYPVPTTSQTPATIPQPTEMKPVYDVHTEETHVENVTVKRFADQNLRMVEMLEGAQEGTRKEHEMTLLESLKLYPKAIAFSVLISCCIIMEGYDLNLMQGFFAFPQFRKKYGVQGPDGTYQLTAAWQAGLTNGAAVGEILGLFLNGIIAERYGYRKTVLGSLLAVTGFIFIMFFAQNIETLEVGIILCGIPWGIFQTLTTVYASEVCPVALRAYLTTFVNLCWVIGTLLGQGVLRAFLDRSDQWAYRIPFAIQWFWPIPIALGVIFAPESPWWLVRKGRNADAKNALLRLTSRNHPNFNADDTIAMMIYTNELEIEASAGTSYLDCFKGIDLRRTEIVCFTFAIQNLSGSAFMGYSTYFFQQAGLETKNAFNLAMAQYSLGAIGTIGSWFMMMRFGRRTLYFGGLCTQFGILLITGFLALAPESNKAASWAVGGTLLAYTFVYDLAVGSVCYSLVAELPSNRLRTKTVVLARNTYNLVGLVNNVIIPLMLNPTAWNWKAKSGFFWAGLCFLCAVWTYFRLPEPKGRTYGELDILFENKVSARKFNATIIDGFQHGSGALDDVDEKNSQM